MGAPAAGIELSVAYLFDRKRNPALERLRARGIEPQHVPVQGLLSPRSLAAVTASVRQAAPDLVHTHLDYADLLGGAAARRVGVPALSTLHVTSWGGSIGARLKALLFAQARRRLHARVIAVSDAARGAYLERWDVPQRVVTVHNGIEGRPEPGSGPAVRAELGLDPGDLVVTMLSVLRAGKGHQAAFAAVGQLLGEFPRLRLLVAGEGPQRETLERQAAALGDRCVFAGHRDDVMRLLDASDVLLHPSQADALPTALLEAMAAGVAIVASRVGGIPEIVEHGTTGVLVDPPGPERIAAGLRELLADPAVRERLATAAESRFTETFTADAWARRLCEVYRRVLQ